MKFVTDEQPISDGSPADLIAKGIRGVIMDQLENEATGEDVIIGIGLGIEVSIRIMAQVFEWDDETKQRIAQETWKSIACQIDPDVRITLNMN